MSESKLFAQIQNGLLERFHLPLDVYEDVDQEGQITQHFVVQASGMTIDQLLELEDLITDFHVGVLGEIKSLNKRVLIRAEAVAA